VCEHGRSWEERQREKEQKKERKRKESKKTVSIKLQKSRDGSDCSFEIWKFNLILFISVF
jgi:hypothetical protein